LTELFVPVLASLITSMAGHPWRAAALLAGGLGLAMVAAHWVIYFLERQKKVEPSRFDVWQLRGSLFSLGIYSLIAISAVNLFGWGLHLLAAMCVWLLLSGSFEAWWLLEPKGIAKATADD
jgi:hypothetical protein